MNKNTKEQFKQAQNGNKKVREQLVIDNLGLVKWQAGKFVKYKNHVGSPEEPDHRRACMLWLGL